MRERQWGFSLAELAAVVLIVALISGVVLWRFLAVERYRAGRGGTLTVVTPDRIAWKQASPPAASPLIAVLSGDPAVPGMAFIVRLKAETGCTTAALAQPAELRITVLEGTVTAGLEQPGGAVQAIRLPAGSFCAIPGQLSHFMKIEAGAVLQLEGTAPFHLACSDTAGSSVRVPGAGQ